MIKKHEKIMLMWLPIAKHLCRFLKTHTVGGKPIFCGIFDDEPIYIGVGSKQTARCYPSIEIIFDEESKTAAMPNTHGEGNVVLWLDFYTNTGADEPLIEYEKAYYVANEIAGVLNAWATKILEDTDIAVLPVIENILSDGDSFRPMYMNRIVLSVKWRY